MATKDLKVKRMVIDGETKAIKFDMIVNDVIYVVKKNDMYEFYFPQDAENNIYVIGFSCPVAVLDGFCAVRMENNIKAANDELYSGEIPSALDSMGEFELEE